MRPLIQIVVNGEDVSGHVVGRILKGQIVEHIGGRADELSLTLSNYDGRLEKPRRGASIDIMLGFEGAGVDKVGAYKVTGVTRRGAQATYDIKGEAADFYATLKEQKTRSWVDKPLGEALDQIARDNGLTLAMSDTLAALKGRWFQTGVSDIHWVTQQARLLGAIGKVAEGRLVFVEQGAGTTASGQPTASLTITPNDLEGDFSITDQDRPNRGKVQATYWDRLKGERREIEAGEGDGPAYRFPQLFGQEDEARRAVEARKREFDAEGKTFSGVLRTGLTAISAGARLITEGFGDDDDMTWQVERVVREFDQRGYVVAFECKPPKAPPKSAARSKPAKAAPQAAGRTQEAGAIPIQPIG